MATQAKSQDCEAGRLDRRISISRLAAAAGVSATAIFVLCWLGTLFPFGSPTHAYIAVFTPAPIQSAQALGEGSLWSLLFGALSGAVFALAYNLFAGLERPSE
jgi:hypothetical protein